VQEVFRAAIEKRGMPKEVLSDNGRQYHTWRGKSKFTTMLTKLGIRHIRSRPYHPQTCGKIESFWRNLYQECLTKVPLATFEEAEAKIGEYIENTTSSVRTRA
jgi:transposase InsO family protein